VDFDQTHDGAEAVNIVSDRVRAELLSRIPVEDVLTPRLNLNAGYGIAVAAMINPARLTLDSHIVNGLVSRPVYGTHGRLACDGSGRTLPIIFKSDTRRTRDRKEISVHSASNTTWIYSLH
jgi:hypothetical protein